ncbi:hypothetical protein [Planococcus chinensis]|uniref:Uncharacterized protein n=1 Tax=Planococcus chinensis TaxID=272917 RepID=A0ABW4QKM2_9BACL
MKLQSIFNQLLGMKRNMGDEIRQLIYDRDNFAKLITDAKLSKLSIDLFEIEDEHMLSFIVFAEKSQFNNWVEAYSALFKRYLYAMEDWDIWIEARETDEEWTAAMKNIWIHEYFFKWHRLVFEPAHIERLVSSVKGEFIALNKPSPKIEQFTRSLTNVEAILIRKGSVYDHFFGESDGHYFIYDWGIYD